MHSPNYYLPDPKTGDPLPWHHSRISAEQIIAADNGETLEERAARLERERDKRQAKKQERQAGPIGWNKGNPRQRVPFLAFIDAMNEGKLKEGDTVTLSDLKEMDIIGPHSNDDRQVSQLCTCLCDIKSPWRLESLPREGRKNPKYKKARAPLAWIIRPHR